MLCVEDEVAVDEDNDDNYNSEEENENEITKPRASVIRDAIDILGYSMYVDNTELRTLTLKLSKIVEAYNARKCKAIGDH